MHGDIEFSLTWEARTHTEIYGHKNPSLASYCNTCGRPLLEKVPHGDIAAHITAHMKQENWPIDEFGDTTGSAIWLYRGVHLGLLSRKFPAVLFMLTTMNPIEDIYTHEYYAAGEFQRAEGWIEYEPYRPSDFRPIPKALL